jgi:hypothetical protein
MVIEARLAVDQPVGGQDRTVGVEDELSEPISGVDQPDERLIGVGHIKQLVVIFVPTSGHRFSDLARGHE